MNLNMMMVLQVFLYLEIMDLNNLNPSKFKEKLILS
jgi:hypothetical protein